MKSYKKFTILALTLLGFTSQTVLANDASHPTNNSIGSSTTSSASPFQVATENQPTTPSSSEQETKPTLPTESKLQTGWVKEDGKWTYYSQTGVKFTDTLYEGYLFDKNGYLLENSWYQMANKWYYANGSGKYLSNQWSQINGKWYAFDQNGTMMANTWKGNYYLKSSGAMADKEWVYDPNYSSWFYLKSGGRYAEQQWIGSYYLKSGGYMAHKEWLYDQDYQAWYYLKEDGVYVTGTYTIDGSSHFFKDNGKWVQELPKGFEKGRYSKTIFLDPGLYSFNIS